VLDDAFAWFIVPFIAVGRIKFIPPMYGTLQNLKDSENNQRILHQGSIYIYHRYGIVADVRSTAGVTPTPRHKQQAACLHSPGVVVIVDGNGACDSHEPFSQGL
jgi:hypothetical protein